MFSFLKQWGQNAAEYRRHQQELTEILARSGINFMHLHPEITKFLVGIARQDGAEGAVTQLNSAISLIDSSRPGLTREQSQQQLINFCKSVNSLAR